MSQAVSTSGSLLSVIVNPWSGSSAECGVTYVESLALDNPAVLRELDSGSYVLYGKFKAYSGDDTIIVFESKLNANIVKSTDRSSIMIFNPVRSKVECLTIYDDGYERNDVELQDIAPPIICDESGTVITVQNSADRPLRGLTVYGKTTQDGTPSEDKPVDPMGTGTDSPLRIVTAGRNLATLMMRVGSNFGITSSYDAQTGVVTVTGTATQMAFVSYWLLDPIPAGVPLVIGMGNGSSDGNIAIRAQSASENANTTIATLSSTNRVVKVTLTHAFEFLSIRVNAGATVNMKMQIGVVAGSDIAGYTWTHPDDQTSAEIIMPGLHIAVGGLLHGLPAVSGGNYTDENGQQWIADTVEYDAETGTAQLVQRVGSVTFDGSADEDWSLYPDGNKYIRASVPETKTRDQGMCTHYQANEIYSANKNIGFSTTGNTNMVYIRPSDYATITVDAWRSRLAESPVTVLYVLAKQKIMPITGDELAALAQLRSRYPATTIYNDAGAQMAARYVADTKNYVDKRIEQAVKTTLVEQNELFRN